MSMSTAALSVPQAAKTEVGSAAGKPQRTAGQGNAAFTALLAALLGWGTVPLATVGPVDRPSEVPGELQSAGGAALQPGASAGWVGGTPVAGSSVLLPGSAATCGQGQADGPGTAGADLSPAGGPPGDTGLAPVPLPGSGGVPVDTVSPKEAAEPGAGTAPATASPESAAGEAPAAGGQAASVPTDGEAPAATGAKEKAGTPPTAREQPPLPPETAPPESTAKGTPGGRTQLETAALTRVRSSEPGTAEKVVAVKAEPLRMPGSAGRSGYHWAMADPPQGSPLETVAAKDVPQVFGRLLEQARWTGPAGRQEVTLQLEPENLGRVHLTVLHQGGLVSARFEVENAAAREVLQAGLLELRADLAAQGVRVNELHVLVGQEADGGSGGWAGQGESWSSGQHAGGRAGSAWPDLTRVENRAAPAALAAGLDLRV